MTGVVIIGAGQAGGRAALALRDGGYDGPVTLIGSESLPPYERPPLSKAVLTGAKQVADGLLASPETYAEKDISLRTGTRVLSIDTDAQTLVLEDGSTLGYDKLILATGARPRALSLPGSTLTGVHLMRNAADARAIREGIAAGGPVVIIGGGFIGLEVAASARVMGAQVTVLEAQPRLLQRSLPAPAAAAIARLHESRGVEIRTGVQLEGFAGNGRVSAVQLADGSELPAAVAVVGIGITPDCSLAADAGLEVGDGILTDEFCRAGHKNIYAIGDCAKTRLLRYGRAIRLESYQNADQQAAVAAAHILGSGTAYDPVPWLWSEQFDWMLQTAGFPNQSEEVILRDLGPEKGKFFFGLNENRLTSVAALGPGASVAKDVRVTQMMIEKGISPAAEALADPARPLKKLMKEG